LTIKHIAYRFAHEFKGGAVAVAAMMGLGSKILQNKLNVNGDSHRLSIEEFEMLVDFTEHNLDVAEYFAEKVNGVVVILPEFTAGDMALLDAYMNVQRKLGKLAEEFQVDYADGEIDKKEFKRIERKVDEVQATLLEFKAAIQRVVR
jgi:hypothetical protein